MHKKLLLFTIIFFSQITTAATAKTPAQIPFTGFYGNMNFGWMNADVDLEQQYQIIIPLSLPPVIVTHSASPELINNSITGGLGLGFASALKHTIIWGVEGRVNIESLTAHFDGSFNNASNNFMGNTNTSVKLENDFSLLFKLGYLLQPKTLIYGLIGPAWGNFNLYSSARFSFIQQLPLSGVAAATESGYETGWLAGVGMEYLISKNASVGLEYTHTDYGNLDFPERISKSLNIFGIPLPDSSISNSTEINAKTNNVLLKLNYYIG